MVIFHHVDEAEDKGEEVKEGAIHQIISNGRRSFATKNVPWIRSLERMIQWRKRERGEHKIEEGKGREKLNFELCLTRLSHSSKLQQVLHMLLFIDQVASLRSFLEKTSLRSFFEKTFLRSQSLATHTPLITKLTSLRSFLEKIPKKARAQLHTPL